MTDYPEHEKLKAVSDHSQAIGEFLDWLSSQGITLAVQHEHSEYCYMDYDDEKEPHWLNCGFQAGSLERWGVPVLNLLSTYFEIDLEKIEREKRQMLDEIRSHA